MGACTGKRDAEVLVRQGATAVARRCYGGTFESWERRVCEYCIPAHTSLAKTAGATDEEIKTAIAIAADVSLNSSMLYGAQFDMVKFMEMFPQ